MTVTHTVIAEYYNEACEAVKNLYTKDIILHIISCEEADYARWIVTVKIKKIITYKQFKKQMYGNKF